MAALGSKHILRLSSMLLRNCPLSIPNIFKKIFSTTRVVNFRKKPRMLSKKKKNISISLELLNSLFNSSIKPYLNVMHIKILCKFLKPVNECKNICTFVIDETVAQDIVKKISCKPEDVVIEGNPGIGLITINLIKSSVSHICVLENSSLQFVSLHQIIIKHRRRITRQNLIMDQDSFRAISLSLDEAAKHNSSVKFVGICTSFYFLRGLVLFFCTSYSQIKNFELYLVVTSSICQSLVTYCAKNLKYLPYCTLNLFFNIDKLTSYPRRAFLPPSLDNNENMNLLKITINTDFLKNFEKNELEEYFIFLTILGRKKSHFVISTLEKWLPNCGPYLISKGVSILNRVEDFSPQDTFILFKLLKKHEEYEDFKNCIRFVFQHVHRF